MRRLSLLAFLSLVPATAAAQGMLGSGSTPLAVDLRKVPVGSWAEYSMSLGGGMTMKSRWALVGRDAKGNTVEMAMEGGPMAMMGGAMTVKMVLAPNPIGAEKPVSQIIMQVGDRDPMDMPLTMPNVPAQKFEKPDPKKLVGKETITTAAGTFKTSHYRDVQKTGTIDIWISPDVAPLGTVKMKLEPKPGAVGPQGQPVPQMTMELVARGSDAKPRITKPPKPFNPQEMFGGGHGGPPPGKGPPGGPGGAPPVGKGPPVGKAPPPATSPPKK